MKKVIVSTYCEWTSIGSILQAFALKKTIEMLGANETIIKKESMKDKKPINYDTSVSIKSLFKNIQTFKNKKNINEAYKKNMKFIEKNLNVISFDVYENLKSNPPIGDIYIAGSDQIWHPNINRLDFLLDYVPKGKKRISYAASMGIEDLDIEKQDIFKNNLSKFDKISVREKGMIDILSPLLNEKILFHVDPTFLLEKQEWKKIEKPVKIKNKYILLYVIYWDRSLNNKLKKLHKESGYDIVCVYTGTSNIYANMFIHDASPDEFLWLIDNAEAIITSSFHGAVFSIIFNKRFCPIINPNSRSRISNLLDLFNLPARPLEKLFDNDINYDDVNSKIGIEKERSISYLRGELYGDE